MTSKSDYPLGFVAGSHEVFESFSDEAALLGAMTILWNRLEYRLRDLFIQMSAPHRDFATALWDRNRTHKGRADLIVLALETISVVDAAKPIIEEVLKETHELSQKRNALIHGEYVLRNDTDLTGRHAKPLKPPTYTSATLSELWSVVDRIDALTDKVTRASLAMHGEENIQRLIADIRDTWERHLQGKNAAAEAASDVKGEGQ